MDLPMRLEVKPRYQPARECSLDEVHSMLACGELVGEDNARIPGSDSWRKLSEIPEVSIPHQEVRNAPELPYSQTGFSNSPYRKARSRNSIDRLVWPIPETKYRYKSLKVLSWFLLGLLGFFGVLTALMFAIDVTVALQPDIGPTEGLEKLEITRLLILLVTFLVVIFTYIIFGWWIVRANKNVHSLGAVGLRDTPGWALGWFFVPLFCLWRPYIAMKQLWYASHDPPGWAMRRKAWFVSIWWTLWLAWNGLSQWSARLQLSIDPGDVMKSKLVNVSASVLGLASITSAVILVHSINRAQIRAKNSMHLSVSTDDIIGKYVPSP
jgi:hypothetical protein